MTARGEKIVEAVAHLVTARDELRKAYECARDAGFPALQELVAEAGRAVAAQLDVVRRSISAAAKGRAA